MSSRLASVHILLVEDEPIIAMTAEDMLAELGCAEVRVVDTLAGALMAAQEGAFDVAVLDINLNGAESFPVAAMLKELATPFVFTTGYGASGVGDEYSDVPVVAKPYQLDDLREALLRALVNKDQIVG